LMKPLMTTVLQKSLKNSREAKHRQSHERRLAQRRARVAPVCDSIRRGKDGTPHK
jgi:hypothetical protein